MKNLYIFNFNPACQYHVKKVHVFLFLFSLIASFLLMEQVNRYFIVTQSKHFVTLSEFEQKKGGIEVLFLGDSHFRRGLDTDQFKQKTFNFSFLNSSYLSSFYILRRYIKEMPQLKMVVLPLDLHSFSSFRTFDTADSIFWDRLINYEEVSSIAGRKINRNLFNITMLNEKYGKMNFINNLKDFVFRKITGNKFSSNEILDQQQAGEDSTDFVDMNEKALEKVKQQLMGFEPFDPVLITYFQKILELCAKHQIKVITLEMPLSKYYIAHAAKYVQKGEIEARILNNPSFKPYLYKNLDYLELYFDKMEYFSWAWRDGDHLNLKGKKYFSTLISKEISELTKKI